MNKVVKWIDDHHGMVAIIFICLIGPSVLALSLNEETRTDLFTMNETVYEDGELADYCRKYSSEVLSFEMYKKCEAIKVSREYQSPIGFMFVGAGLGFLIWMVCVIPFVILLARYRKKKRQEETIEKGTKEYD